jgi:putative spermidine/putrescine transport system ATP-binding protein
VHIPGGKLDAGTAVQVCIRPEQLRLADAGTGLPGTIELSMPLGAQIVHEIRLADGAAIKVIEARDAGARLHKPGAAVRLVPADGALANAFALPKGGTASPMDRVSAT